MVTRWPTIRDLPKKVNLQHPIFACGPSPLYEPGRRRLNFGDLAGFEAFHYFNSSALFCEKKNGEMKAEKSFRGERT